MGDEASAVVVDDTPQFIGTVVTKRAGCCVEDGSTAGYKKNPHPVEAGDAKGCGDFLQAAVHGQGGSPNVGVADGRSHTAVDEGPKGLPLSTKDGYFDVRNAGGVRDTGQPGPPRINVGLLFATECDKDEGQGGHKSVRQEAALAREVTALQRRKLDLLRHENPLGGLGIDDTGSLWAP